MSQPAVSQNLKLFPFIYFLDRCWFWLPVWLFFYLLFTDYTGVAILDATMLLIFFLAEIPSGIFADRIGKKTTLVIAWLLMGIATIVMGYSPNFTVLFLTQIFVLVLAALFAVVLKKQLSMIRSKNSTKKNAIALILVFYKH